MGDNAGKAHNRYLTKIGLTEAEFLLAKSAKEATAKAKRTTHPDQSSRRIAGKDVKEQPMVNSQEITAMEKALDVFSHRNLDSRTATFDMVDGRADLISEDLNAHFQGEAIRFWMNQDGSSELGLCRNCYGIAIDHHSTKTLRSPMGLDAAGLVEWIHDTTGDAKLMEQLRKSGYSDTGERLRIDAEALKSWSPLPELPNRRISKERSLGILQWLKDQPGMDSVDVQYDEDKLPPTGWLHNMALGFQQFNQTFPGVVTALPRIVLIPAIDGGQPPEGFDTAAGAYSTIWGDLKFSTDPETIRYEDQWMTGSVQSVVVHELTHALESAILSSDRPELMEMKQKLLADGFQLRAAGSVPENQHSPSAYGKTAAAEFFAEMAVRRFTAGHNYLDWTDGQPDKPDQRMEKLAVDHLREISGLLGGSPPPDVCL